MLVRQEPGETAWSKEPGGEVALSPFPLGNPLICVTAERRHAELRFNFGVFWCLQRPQASEKKEAATCPRSFHDTLFRLSWGTRIMCTSFQTCLCLCPRLKFSNRKERPLSAVVSRHCRIANIEIKMLQASTMHARNRQAVSDGHDGHDDEQRSARWARAGGRQGKASATPPPLFFLPLFSYHTNIAFTGPHRPIRLSMPALLRGFSSPRVGEGGILEGRRRTFTQPGLVWPCRGPFDGASSDWQAARRLFGVSCRPTGDIAPTSDRLLFFLGSFGRFFSILFFLFPPVAVCRSPAGSGCLAVVGGIVCQPGAVSQSVNQPLSQPAS